jgi:hypothetical protein
MNSCFCSVSNRNKEGTNQLSALSQPSAPATAPRLALGQCRHTLWQSIHDPPSLAGRHAKPCGDFTARPSTADAEACFRLDHADLHTRRFDIGESAIVHIYIL